MKSVSFKLIPQYFGSLVYDNTACRYSAFDADATTLLASAMNRPIHEAVSFQFSGKKQQAALLFAEAYRERGYFNAEGIFPGDAITVDSPSDHLVGPLTIHLEVTNDCNLRCSHCFAADNIASAPLSLRELDILFKDLAALGSYRIGLTGGEPLLRPEILDIIDLAISHGLSPCMTTNGLLLTETLAAELGKRKLVWLNVSLDGATARTNDAVRGSGMFARVIDRIALLRNSASFSLAFTVMSHNIHEMEEFCVLAKTLGAAAAVFRPLYPVGAAKRRLELIPKFSDYLKALQKLKDAGLGFEADLCSFHPWGPGTRHDHHAVVHQNFGCGAGNTCCSISANGDVSPCSFLGKHYIAGNLRQTPFQTIWNHGAAFTAIRSLSGDQQCATCDEYDICGGGCRARALALRNSINAADPWCSRQEEVCYPGEEGNQ